MADDLAAIEAATWTYLDGLYEGDVDKLASVFHPTSALTQSWEGELEVDGAWVIAQKVYLTEKR